MIPTKELLMIKSIIFLTGLLSAASTLMAADRSPSILPPPALAAAERPADGSGIYRLSLGGAIQGMPLIVLVEVNQGKMTGAVALPTHTSATWAEVDFSGLVFTPDRLKGTLKVGFWPLFDPAKNAAEIEGKPNPKFTAYEAKPKQFATITLDLALAGREGKGTWQGAWEGPESFIRMSPGKGGSAESLWQPAPLDSGQVERQEVDLFCKFPLLKSTLPIKEVLTPTMWFRMAMERGKTVKALAWFENVAISRGYQSGLPLKLTKQDITIKDGLITGQLEAAFPDGKSEPFTVTLQGRVLGSQLIGTATFTQGATSATTPWIGLLHQVPTWHLPVEAPSGQWTWQHDLPADAALTAAAAEESLLPVLPGEPGRFEFWTWRSLVNEKRSQGSIHPPSFDVQETPGAIKYRYQLDRVRTAKKSFTFESDKPWRPLAPIWKDMEPGQYQLTVTAIDAQGKDMPGPMRLGILDPKSAKAVFTESPAIRVDKRPAFSGPYASITGRDWNRAILQAARWVFAPIGHQENRGQAPGGAYWTAGEGGTGGWITCNLQSRLAVRAFSDRPVEVADAEECLRFLAEEIQVHQTVAPTRGVIHMYKGYTALNQLPGRAILDAWLQTGDERWKGMAMSMARGLASLQKPNGAFKCSEGNNGPPWGYFAQWPAGNPEFGASELLYLFGRIRRDLKTDEFAAVEEKAYCWMMESALPRRFFPMYDTHSMSQGYPVWQHAQSALFFSRYLLELAPPERRDVKLAEELALWAEDHDINWTRAAAGPQTGPITPQVVRGDRGNDPAHNNLFAAIVFHQLSIATGKALWAAKAEALATAVLQSIDPKTGYFNHDLAPNMFNHDLAPGKVNLEFGIYSYHNGTQGPAAAIQLLREYAELRKQRP